MMLSPIECSRTGPTAVADLGGHGAISLRLLEHRRGARMTSGSAQVLFHGTDFKIQNMLFTSPLGINGPGQQIENLSCADQGFGIGKCNSLSESSVRHCLPGLTCLRLGTIPSNAVPRGSEPQKAGNSRLLPQIFSFCKNVGRICRDFGGADALPLLLFFHPWYKALCL